MKKLLGVVTVFFCVAFAAAQERKSIALNVYGAYIFQDRVALDEFTGYAREGFQYGAGLEYFIESNASVDLKYLRQNSRFPLYGPGGAKANTVDDKGVISYVLVGGTEYFGGNSHSKILPFAGIGLGIGILDSKEAGSATKFAWDGKLGARIKTSSKVSFKVQATLQSIMSTFGSDFYTSSVGVVAVPDYATLLQFGLGGGLSYNF